MNRNLDGYYFRVQRNDKWCNICFSDLTDKEKDEMLKDRSVEWLQSLCKGLGNVIKDIGEQLDLVAENL